MAARSESARRISNCVTALLRDQPFFGSLALRLPIGAVTVTGWCQLRVASSFLL